MCCVLLTALGSLSCLPAAAQTATGQVAEQADEKVVEEIAESPVRPAAEPAAALPLAMAADYAAALDHLAAGRPQAARALLESIVQAQPDFAGAWLDLALASQQSGDSIAALEHLAYLRHRFTLSPPLRQLVKEWQIAWQRPADAAPASGSWQGEINLDWGYSNNLNGGLAHDQIDLSLPGGGLVSLPLAPTTRPQGAAYQQFEVYAARRWQIGAARLYPVLRLRARTPNDLPTARQLGLHAGAIYQSAPDDQGRRWQSSFLWQHERLAGQALFISQRLALQRLSESGPCRLAWGGEAERRHTPGLPLDGRLFWLDLGLSCPLGAPERAVTRLAASLRAGQEYARSDERPGGDSRHYEFTLHLEHALPGARRFEALWQHGRSHDAEGYSPLLANNARRQQRRDQLLFTLRQPLSGGWHARLQLNVQRQRSNLPLFEQRARQISLGIGKAF